METMGKAADALDVSKKKLDPADLTDNNPVGHAQR